MNREEQRENARKEFDSKKDFTIKCGVGVEKCEHMITGKTEWSFWAEIHTTEGQMDVESNCFYETEKEASDAAEDFNSRFPIAYIQDQEKAKKILDQYKISFTQRKKKPHLSVVK